jgi:hypothetical protein
MIKSIILEQGEINKCIAAINFDECIECIEINLVDSGTEFYNCVVALGNLPYNLQKLIININANNKFGNSATISRNGDLIYRSYITMNLPGLVVNTKSYTLDELKMKLKIPFGCDFVVNEPIY